MGHRHRLDYGHHMVPSLLGGQRGHGDSPHFFEYDRRCETHDQMLRRPLFIVHLINVVRLPIVSIPSPFTGLYALEYWWHNLKLVTLRESTPLYPPNSNLTSLILIKNLERILATFCRTSCQNRPVVIYSLVVVHAKWSNVAAWS